MLLVAGSNDACPATKVAEGLKQLLRAAMPGPLGSIRQKPLAASDTHACVLIQSMPCGLVIPGANNDPAFAAPGTGVGEGTGAGGPNWVTTVPSVVLGATTL